MGHHHHEHDVEGSTPDAEVLDEALEPSHPGRAASCTRPGCSASVRQA